MPAVVAGADLALVPWSCVRCDALLGLLTVLGAVHLHRGRHGCPQARNVLVDLAARSVAAHCPYCHAWEEALYDPETRTFRIRPWTGYRPGDCGRTVPPAA